MVKIDFNEQGLLPTFINSEISTHGRSPHLYSIKCFAQDFVYGYPGLDTKRRASIINGLLKYRELLYQHGIVKGFHWLDGSFVTNKELLKKESPNDLDLFSIFELPEGESQVSLDIKFPYLSDQIQIKKDLSLDTYFYFIDPLRFDYDNAIQYALYFHGIWSQYKHTSLYKGYIRVDLSPEQDRLYLAELIDQAKGVENECS